MFYLLLLLISFNCNATNWVSGNTIKVIDPSSSAAPRVVFFNSYTDSGPKINEWTTVDVTSIIQEQVVAVHLIGILIITHGLTVETADLKIYFRNDDNYDTQGFYKHQVIEASPNNGQRSTMSAWVALKDNKFQYKWEIGNSLGVYPNKSAYGANLVIDAYLTN